MARKARPAPWLPAAYDHDDVVAIQAVHRGEADAAQQRRTLNWLINKAAETYDEPFRSDSDGGDRDTAFALGKAHVGKSLVKMINLTPEAIAKLRSE